LHTLFVSLLSTLTSISPLYFWRYSNYISGMKIYYFRITNSFWISFLLVLGLPQLNFAHMVLSTLTSISHMYFWRYISRMKIIISESQIVFGFYSGLVLGLPQLNLVHMVLSPLTPCHSCTSGGTATTLPE
jgi:hypothetical protein